MTKKSAGYEMMVIFKPLLPDDVRKGAHQAIVALVKELRGKIKNADVWGKRYLSYHIKGHEEGYYIVYELELIPESLKDFKVRLSRISEVLRFLITRINKPEELGSKLNKKVIEI